VAQNGLTVSFSDHLRALRLVVKQTESLALGAQDVKYLSSMSSAPGGMTGARRA